MFGNQPWLEGWNEDRDRTTGAGFKTVRQTFFFTETINLGMRTNQGAKYGLNRGRK